ncbi:MAG TPA: hypothetical protein GX735_08125, partial [Firmicutes bacterium]|nr:hypothetical protein [Bacillota bacterium]
IARDRNYSEEVASAIDREVRHFIDESYDKATRLLKENRDKLDLLAQTLLERETLEAEELERLLSGGEAAAAEPELEGAREDSEIVTEGKVPPYRPRRENRPLFRKPQEGLS